ncbi:hypothetical protein J2Z21_000974 [Streptomyces griseochromogenes]|uniref:SAM-dependent methyltransferase n=1 Tax=Streptomyces griseochromogenes TaxID=68214 RepID=A0ABS4LKY9_9ACTN|nr:hypothetical protein [Streptomyces griseochromogenes]
MFHTALGRAAEAYRGPAFLARLGGGVDWVVRRSE